MCVKNFVYVIWPIHLINWKPYNLKNVYNLEPHIYFLELIYIPLQIVLQISVLEFVYLLDC